MVFATKFSDVHCGMRALTLDAKRLDLQAQGGWEYASEMIIRAVKLRLKTTEFRFISTRIEMDVSATSSVAVCWSRGERAGVRCT